MLTGLVVPWNESKPQSSATFRGLISRKNKNQPIESRLAPKDNLTVYISIPTPMCHSNESVTHIAHKFKKCTQYINIYPHLMNDISMSPLLCNWVIS